MAGDVTVSNVKPKVYGGDFFMSSQYYKKKYGVEILCEVCKYTGGKSCKWFKTPNKEIRVCNRFKKR